MPIADTKLFLSSAISSPDGGYRLLPVAPGDFAATGPLVSGIADLNGDGIADIITGAPLDDDKLPDAGRIFVNYGTATGGTTTYVDDALTKIVIDGVNAGDLAGAAVGSVSDLNGDGRAEILVGAPTMENGVKTDAGAAFVLWGLAAGGGIDLNDPFTASGKGFAIKGEQAGDLAGTTITSIADLNGDGKADIIVGAPGNDFAKVDAGAAYVVWGKSTGSVVNLTNVAAGTGGFRIIGEGKNDAIGSVVGTLGDQNGDGKSEILLGSAKVDAGGLDSGAAYVVFGKSTGTEVDLSDVAAGIGGYRIAGDVNDSAGSAVTGLGDINGDGIADMLISAPGNDSAYVVYGKNDTTEVLLSNVGAGIGGFKIVAEDQHDLDNISVTGGRDLNRDGINDIVIGASLNQEGGFDAGAVYVVWGGANSTVDLSLVAQSVGGAKIVGDAGSMTGSSVAIVNDMNGDGTADLLIGASGLGADSANIVYTPANWLPDNNVYGTNADDVMGAGYGSAIHQIGTGADNIMGLGGNDIIDAGAGNDTIDGGTGSDAMTGGLGDDTYYVDNAADTTIENAGEGTDTVIASVNYTLNAEIENLTLEGAARSGTGNAMANTITGTGFNDTLNGAGGADTLIGGFGNDVYVVDDLGDVAQEAAGQGTDTVQASLDWTLGANLENLTLTGAARNATGNTLNNTLTGTAFNDVLNGGLGNDTMIGGLGDDTYHVDSISDVVSEALGAGTDTVISTVNLTLAANVENLTLAGTATTGTGNTLNNTITGNALNNTLNGGAGADTLVGGFGDDTYIVDNAGDVITENDAEGNDTVQTSIDYTLNAGAFVENITLTGAARAATGNEKVNTLTGTAFNDTLNGGAGADIMNGGAGNDTYVVDDAGDVTNDTAGTDTVQSSVDGYTLGADIENLTLIGTAHTGTGNALNNTLLGGAGNDTLNGLDGNDTINGGTGADTMVGGIGDDTYYIDNVGDVVVEDALGGTDTIIIDSDYVLTNENIENVHVVGTGHTVTGSAGNNTLSGSSGDDTLDGGEGDDLEVGGEGDDTLISHSGHDSLSGGAGDDTYVIKGGIVEIEDFLGHDTLDTSDCIEDNYIDLSGDSVSHIENEDCHLGNGGTTLAPLDVQFLQDLSGSFGDDIANVRTLVPQIVTALQAVQANSQFGSSTFVDKAVNPFGAAGEWVYNTLLSQTTNVAALTAAYNSMAIRFGNDAPEAQIEALMQLALHQTEVGFRPDSARFVILFTDAPFHVAGDGAAGGITTPNNGDAIMDGVVPGTGEDYPMIAQVKSALEAANIIPIFAIAGGYEATYQGLATQLGRGAVVTLTADSSNVVAAITGGLTAATVTHIEDAKGGSGHDTLKGSDYANVLTGNGGDDIFIGGLGDDSCIGGIGTDTATYGGKMGDYSYSSLGGIRTITDNNVADGNEGKDTLSSVEVLKFSNGTVNLVALTVDASTANDIITVFNNSGWTVHGLDGADSIKGRTGADTLFGDAGNDAVYGQDGNDTIIGGAGNDRLYGGNGDDHFNVTGTTDGYDRFDGGAGIDTIHATANGTAITMASFTGIEAITADGHTDVRIKGGTLAEFFDFTGVTLTGITQIDVGSGNDVVIGSAAADIIKGNIGNDVLNGAGGLDYLYGGLGSDTFVFDANSLTARDVVRDFSLVDGDKIELSNLLEGYDPLTSSINDFVRITEVGANSYVSVDKDGTAGPATFTQIARIDGVLGMTDEQAMLTAGTLLVA